ncbi:MAG: YciI family protein [Aestuariivirga sp.]
MKYMLLIYGSEAAASPAPGTPEFDAYLGEYQAFTETVQKAGKYGGGEALQPTSTATSVRVRKGKTETMDGPFAETKEQLGGFYILDCKNLDEAIAYAAKIPDARTGTVEVRPIMVFE